MSTFNKCFLDIETLPPSGGGHLERIRANVKAPAQYKKPDSIAQWLADNADAEAQEQFGRLGLNGLYGQICVVCFAIADGRVNGAVLGSLTTPTERDVIAWAFSEIDRQATDDSSSYPRKLIPVGHNIEFDLRFLLHRAVRYGLTVPGALRAAFDPDKGKYNTFDTMRVWSGWKDYVKLTDLTRELLDDKVEDIRGDQVASIFATDPAKVVEHCEQDVERVRGLYRKFAVTLSL